MTVPFLECGKLVVINLKFILPHIYLVPTQVVIRLEFHQDPLDQEIVRVGWLLMIGAAVLMQYRYVMDSKYPQKW